MSRIRQMNRGKSGNITRSVRQEAALLIRLLFDTIYVALISLHPQHRKTKILVQQHFDTVPLGEFCDHMHMVVQMKSPRQPRPLMVRLYEPAWIDKGLRYFYINRIMRNQGLMVPKTESHGTVQFSGRSYFAVVEEFIDGQRSRTWTGELACALGKDLARWHGVVLSKAVAMAIGIRRPDLAYDVKARFRQLDAVQKQHCGWLLKGIESLERDDFRGPYALSHGDLHSANLLTNSDGHLIWLDLDDACRRPIRQDLADVELKILRNAPEMIDAFERGYFALHPNEHRAWLKHRLGWYRICCARNALKKLTSRERPPHFTNSRGSRAQQWLALSSACCKVKDMGQASSELVKNILVVAQPKASS